MKTIASILLIALCSVSSGAGTDPKGSPASVPAESTQKKTGPEDKPSPPATEESADNKPADAPPAIELKHKSAFQMEGDNRNPFWPIGWKPPEHANASAVPEHAAGEIPPTAFMVSSITLDSKTHFAIINGKVMQEGQQFGLQIGTQTYQLTVKSIEDGRVILSRRNQEIVVQLHRK